MTASIKDFATRYDVQVYLEPAEAVASHSAALVAVLLAFCSNGMSQAMLVTSATGHMPDLMETPYRPVVLGADMPDIHPHVYRLGGMTCLAGDVIGDYSFPERLKVGQRLIFDDMAHYTMVKTTTFNGIGLPSIALWNSNTDELEVIKEFGYQDFKERLASVLMAGCVVSG